MLVVSYKAPKVFYHRKFRLKPISAGPLPVLVSLRYEQKRQSLLPLPAPMADQLGHPWRGVVLLGYPPFSFPLPLPPPPRHRRHHHQHGPVQDVNNSAQYNTIDMTHRVKVFHTSIFFSFSINAVVVLILFVVDPPPSPINFVQILRRLWS
jgi:hypothetical protein